MALFQRLANKEFNDEDTKTIQRLCELAKTTVDGAISEMFLYLPDLFQARQEEFFAAFHDVNHQAVRDAYQAGHIRPHYMWPISFPTCTSNLRQFINQWIEKEFFNKIKAKCLILIGSVNTGKARFAQSLSGFYNYYDDDWNPDAFNPYAHYTIYDNIPWDEFENMDYPDKKLLFLQGGRIHTINNRDKPTIVEVYQPAIILLNPENQGSLTDIPCTTNQIDSNNNNNFWNQNACIYRMKDDESFHTP